MSGRVGAIEVVASDFTGFRRVLDTVGARELESFHSLSGQYGLFEDVDLLKQRLEALGAEIDGELHTLTGAPDATLLATIGTKVTLLDSLLEQLSRYVTVADLRGATLTSGDLLQKLQGWIKTLRDWLSGVARQLEVIARR
jgi:hypothetical protein